MNDLFYYIDIIKIRRIIIKKIYININMNIDIQHFL